MGKILSLREAINLIWETVEIGREMESGCPYLFIVGAGISAPEILTANGIIDQCKKKVEQLCQASQTHECAPQPHHILNSKIIKT